MDWMRRQPPWVPGVLCIVCGVFLFLIEHWSDKKQVLTMLPMVTLEQLGIFAMAFGALAAVIGAIRTARATQPRS